MSTHLRAGSGRRDGPTSIEPVPPDLTGRIPTGRVRGRRSAGRNLAAFGILFALVLGACTAAAAPDDVATLADPSDSADASPSASLDPEAAMDAFVSCMREHGVDLQIARAGSDSGGKTSVNGSEQGPKKGEGTDQSKEKFEAANKACAGLLPKGGQNGPGGKLDPAIEQKLLDFSACMREHGIDMPDPQFENGGATVQIGGPDGEGPQIDPESDEFKDAQAACKEKLPADFGPRTDSAP